MRVISAELQTHLDGAVTSMTTCWKITRLDGETFRFTEHDRDLTVDAELYSAASGTLPSAIAQNRDLSADNLEVVAFLQNNGLNQADVEAGLFDFASLDVFQVNYEDLTMGRLWLAKGWTFGAIEVRDHAASVEIRGKAARLQQQFMEVTSPGCRATLGDERCTVDLTNPLYYVDAVVTVVTSRRIFIADYIAEAADRFRFGTILWASGANDTFQMEVKKTVPADHQIELFLPMPYTIEVGDLFRMTKGCAKNDSSIFGCKYFDNILNFRGELFLPGRDRVLDRQSPQGPG